jgi:hypothetical protein
MNRPSVSGTAVMAIRAELLGHACRLFCVCVAVILQSNIAALDIYSIWLALIAQQGWMHDLLEFENEDGATVSEGRNFVCLLSVCSQL